ncbi:hypothetical protein [Clostridium intestinale]|jgi:hypothetical protein|uniref:Uncharacterized protein n=1 Tax=Clostridium intestinale TaxID=36845 RepID=A0A7D6VX88_9CLOT|nr:hypothetical protein [Clostridium intestinale]QLY77811.1 hypothetical protein HZF06_11875 [Clostridium intestinale]
MQHLSKEDFMKKVMKDKYKKIQKQKQLERDLDAIAVKGIARAIASDKSRKKSIGQR